DAPDDLPAPAALQHPARAGVQGSAPPRHRVRAGGETLRGASPDVPRRSVESRPYDGAGSFRPQPHGLPPRGLGTYRALQRARGRPWLRDRASRDLAPEEAERRAGAGEPSAIRFRVPEDDGATRFEDAVYGPQERAHRDIEDFALLRPDGTPLYNHVVVCDDV